ncbi:MAG: type I methionyl aminopeptidase [Candidatus Doudnabacteria bacterium]|nr:type I methionyl aminopeptidase [Candidatus Doudnabacteria bacterium]
MPIRKKSPEEIETIRAGGQLLSGILKELIRMVEPGRSFQELDAYARQQLSKHGIPEFLGYGGFPASVCMSCNQEVVHGIPGDRVMEEGSVLGIDIGLRHKGLVTDMAVTVPVGKISHEDKKLLQVTRDSLKAALDVIRDGARLGDIGAAVMRVVEPHGYGIVRDLVGHGVGFELHEDPSVPNVGRAGDGIRLEAGMVLAIEPMITAGGSHKVKTLEDGWTVVTKDGSNAAHFEHTIAVTKQGYELLTAFDTGFTHEG